MKKNTDYVKWARGIISTAPEDRVCMVAEDPSVLDVCGLALDQLEAELAALRRVEVENWECARDGDGWWVAPPEPRGNTQGTGKTLAEALADYDAKKEQR